MVQQNENCPYLFVNIDQNNFPRYVVHKKDKQ